MICNKKSIHYRDSIAGEEERQSFDEPADSVSNKKEGQGRDEDEGKQMRGTQQAGWLNNRGESGRKESFQGHLIPANKLV